MRLLWTLQFKEQDIPTKLHNPISYSVLENSENSESTRTSLSGVLGQIWTTTRFFARFSHLSSRFDSPWRSSPTSQAYSCWIWYRKVGPDDDCKEDRGSGEGSMSCAMGPIIYIMQGCPPEVSSCTAFHNVNCRRREGVKGCASICISATPTVVLTEQPPKEKKKKFLINDQILIDFYHHRP